ncbi:hypothetical protein [Paenibacillus sp. MBLB4367]
MARSAIPQLSSALVVAQPQDRRRSMFHFNPAAAICVCGIV